MNMYLFPALGTLCCVGVIYYTFIRVGLARGKHKIPPPQTTGNEEFLRFLRVQDNTLEQFIIFLPSLWLFAMYVSALWSGAVALIWCIGRILFAHGYYQEASKRSLGFRITSLALVTAWLGALIAILIRVFKIYLLSA